MSAFNIIRAVFLALFILLNGALLATASIHLTSAIPNDPLRPVDGYLIFESAASILFLFSIIIVDFTRRDATTSTVWFELLWLSVACTMNLCGAAAVTALGTSSSCMVEGLASCTSAQALMGITWTGTLLALAQFTLMVISSIYYSKRHPNVWSAGVRNFQFFQGGGSGKSTVLHSSPPSPSFVPRQLKSDPENAVPHLERIAANWQPTPASQERRAVPPAKPVQAMVFASEPQPLTYAFAPEIPSTRAPTHYNATAVVSVGVLPGRRSSKKMQIAPSLYPSSVQIALDVSPKAAAPRQNTLPSKPAPSAEPLPISDWPRRNPQEPYRRDRSRAAPVVAPVVIPSSAPGPAPTASSPTGRSRGSPRRRPPPLDLSAASPAPLR